MPDKERNALSKQELDEQGATELPDREEMSIIGGTMISGGTPTGAPLAPDGAPTGDGTLTGGDPQSMPILR